MKYYIIKNNRDIVDGAVIDEAPIDGPKQYKYFKMLPLINVFPKMGKIYFSDNYPDQTKVYDFMENLIIAGIYCFKSR